jgi:hypothetical protein
MSESLPPIFENRLPAGSEFPVEFARQQLRGVFTLILDIVGDPDEAQELTQETFIKLFQRKGAAKKLKKAASLLPSIAAETAHDWLREGLHRGRHTPMPTAGDRQSVAPKDAAEWGRLEQELLGNIAVGLDAAHCIEGVGARRRFAGTRIVAIAGLVILFAAGWLTHIPVEQTRHLFASLRKIVTASRAPRVHVLAESRARGIVSNSANGGRLLLETPQTAKIWASGKSEISASFTDDQTGQVVVTTVYGQEDPQ